jgi:hypothetical protein
MALAEAYLAGFATIATLYRQLPGKWLSVRKASFLHDGIVRASFAAFLLITDN